MAVEVANRRAVFVGNLTRSVDAKGRLLVPAEMVRALDAADREGYYLAPGDNNVLLFTRRFFHQMAEGLASPTPFANFGFNRNFFGRAAYRPTDGMGRILLPEALRAEAGIGGEAVLVGCGQYLEIWAKDRHEEVLKTAPSTGDLLRQMQGQGPAMSR